MLQNNFTIITASAGKMLLLVGFLSFVMMVIPVYAQNQVLFVDTTAPGPIHDGMSWATAFTIIQDAIDAAAAYPKTDILVAEGTYFPTRGYMDSSNPRDKTLYLEYDVSLHGGFVGYNNGMPGSTNPDAPDGSFENTVISGDIGIPGDAQDNVFHILRVNGDSGYGPDPMEIDGFKVVNGYAVGPIVYDDYGAGLLVQGLCTTLTVENVTFYANYAKKRGGAVYATYASQDELEFAFCTFHNNYAERGAAMYGIVTRDLEIGNCTFRNNGAYPPLIINGMVQAVPIPLEGGAIYLNEECIVHASNCVLHDNIAMKGSAVYVNPIEWSASGDYRNYWRHCTFAFNLPGLAPTSATFYVEADDLGNPANTNQYFINSIFWDTLPGHRDVYLEQNIQAYVMSSNFDMDTSSPGWFLIDINSMSVDPVFKDSANRNLQLNNVAGALSPCMNAASGRPGKIGRDIIDVDGDKDEVETLPLDMDCFSRTFYGIPDMGAYEVSAIIIPR